MKFTKKQLEVIEKAKQQLIDADKNNDIESSHGDADGALCLILESLGLSDVVKLWNKVDKWYA